MLIRKQPSSSSSILHLWISSSHRAAAGSFFWALFAALVARPACVHAQADTLTTLHSFRGSDGTDPQSGLVQGSDGNFYGTTFAGGAGGYGTVFRLTPAGALTTLYNFSGDEENGPSGLVQGSDGNFYGTTYGTGSNSFGTVFCVTPAGALTTIHTFNGSDGAQPWPTARLVQGGDGSFYGTTEVGGASNDGTVFRITAAGVLTTLYSFTGGDGSELEAGLVQGSDGNFYGTTGRGGASLYDGTVFRITPAGTLTTLHTFAGGDGSEPSGLVQGSDGNFYGTTFAGGADGYGTVFRLTPAGALTTLYSFTAGSEGVNPEAGLVQGSDGNFYGTTYYGGANISGADGYGTVFRVTPSGELTTLYSFTGGNDEGYLATGLAQGSDGSFYGTTASGANEGGTAYKLVVPGVGPAPSSFFIGEAALSNGVYYLAFPNGDDFGYYSFLSDPHYIYHFDLGYEYVFDANDGKLGVYFYDFKSQDFFYTSPSFPFPYLYDFGLNAVLYYYPDPNNAGRYNTDGIRYFYDFATGKIITR